MLELPPGPIEAAHPQLASLVSELEQARLTERVVGKVAELPALVAGWQRQELDGDTFDGPLLGISWPLPFVDRRRGERFAARARVDALEAELEMAQRELARALSGATRPTSRCARRHWRRERARATCPPSSKQSRHRSRPARPTSPICSTHCDPRPMSRSPRCRSTTKRWPRTGGWCSRSRRRRRARSPRRAGRLAPAGRITMILDRTSLPGILAGVVTLAWAVGCGETAPPETAEAGALVGDRLGRTLRGLPRGRSADRGRSRRPTPTSRCSTASRRLTEGTVEIVLRGRAARRSSALRTRRAPGIFNVDVDRAAAGEYDLLFRIRAAPGRRRSPAARAGRQRRGAGRRGARRAPTGPRTRGSRWRSSRSSSGGRRSPPLGYAAGRSRAACAVWRGCVPPAGGEPRSPRASTASCSPAWPYPGQAVDAGEVLFELVPRVASERSLPELEAEVTALEAEAAAARARLARLKSCSSSRRPAGARSRRRGRASRRSSRDSGRARDLDAAGAARDGAGAPSAHAVRAPFAGRIAAVTASPGAAVARRRDRWRAWCARGRGGSRWTSRPATRAGDRRRKASRAGRRPPESAALASPRRRAAGLAGARGRPGQGHGHGSARGTRADASSSAPRSSRGPARRRARRHRGADHRPRRRRRR